MKGDTILDYAEFHLTPPRTRCELFVSADGVTEKLASGFLKPFLTHLRAAEEQIARGFHAIRLERPRLAKHHNERIWFTKGTLERFVRFVSTPEVLERVKTIEDELAQLEQVRNIQASSLLETEDGYLGASSIYSRPEGKTTAGLDADERNGSSHVLRRYPYDVVNSGAEASKRDLLKAMDVRLLALQQEQNTAFSRADAAGFDRNNMADLIAFSEFFGAERLRAACIQFLNVSRKRYEIDASATSSGSDMSLSSASGADITADTEVSSYLKGSGELEGLRTTVVKDVQMKLVDRDTKTDHHSQNRENGCTEARKRWGPPENLRHRPGVIHDEMGYVLENSRGVLENENPEVNKSRGTDQSLHSERGSRLDELVISKAPTLGSNSDGVYLQCTNGRGNTGNRHTTSMASQTMRSNFAENPTEWPNNSELESFLKDPALPSPLKGCQVAKERSILDPEGGTNSEDVPNKVIDVPFKTPRDDTAHRQKEQSAVHNEENRLAEVAREIKQEISSASPESRLGEIQTNSNVYDSSNWQETKQRNIISRYNCEDVSPENYSRTQPDMSRCGSHQRPSSPKRRSASPHRRVQIGRSGVRRSGSVVIRSINYFSSQDRSNRETNSTIVDSSSSDSEEVAKDDIEDQPASVPAPSPAPARRLSVQAAISLFESKQRKDTIEIPLKKRSVKSESCEGSLEGANSSSLGSVKPRRWSERYDNEVCSTRQNEKFSDKQENKAGEKVPPEAHPSSEHAEPSTISMNVVRSETSLGSSCRPLSEQMHKTGITKPSIDSSAANLWQPSTKLAAGSLSAELEAEVEKQKPACQQQMVSSSDTAFEGEKRKQFKLQLEKSLLRESIKRDQISIEDPANSESVTVQANLSEKAKSSEIEFLKRTDSGPSVALSTVTTLSKGGERFYTDFSDGSRQSPPASNSLTATTSTSITQAKDQLNQGCRMLTTCETDAYSFQEGQSSRMMADCPKEKTNKMFGEPDGRSNQRPGRESLGSSLIAPFDFDMQALVKMVDHHSMEDGGQQGRFYEQYRKLRDAKMMEEHTSKKAEREAKLRWMEETLEKRKAEMDARTARLSKKKNEVQGRIAKIQALKADLAAGKKDQEDERNKEQEANQGLSIMDDREQRQLKSSPPSSPSSTPLETRERVFTPKSQLVKKVSQAPPKATTTPRSSTRAANSVSPRSTPRSSTAAPPSQRGSAVLSVADNPLARSVPCFADLRKENTKPSPGRSSGSTRLSVKNAGTGRSRAVTEAAPLEPNSNVWINGTSRTGVVKDEKKRRSTITRKSCATAADFKMASIPGDEGVLAPLKGQRDAVEPAIYSKLRRSAVAPIQEVKPFLRKGRGIGPGAGPGVMKLKASSAIDSARSLDEEALGISTENADAKDGESQTGEEAKKEAVENPGEMEGADVHTITTSRSADEASLSMFEEQEKSEITTDDPVPEDLFENQRACHTISFPIDYETQKRYANTFGAELDANHQAPKKQESVPLAQLLVEGAAEYMESETGAVDSPSFRATSLPREITAPPFSPVAVSPAINSAVRPGAVSDYFSPSSAAAVESPLGSPASWNSSQIQYASEAEIARAQKKWSGAHKPVYIVPPKEPARGFKRLLNFARKSRTPEIVAVDGTSPCTTSEGDDDVEDPRDVRNRSAEDLLRKARLQERNLKEFGHVLKTGQRYHSQEQGLIQSVRSSIPAPPANFRLRDDHLSGGTMLKAPRSFFSLSSFRNRSNEAKSR